MDTVLNYIWEPWVWLILHLHAKVNNIKKPKREQLTVKSIDAHVGIMCEDIWWLVFLDVLISKQSCAKKRRKGKKLVSQLGSRGGVTRVSRGTRTWRDTCCQNCLFWKPDKYNQLKDSGCQWQAASDSAGHDDDGQVKATKRGFDIPRLKMIMTFNLLNQKIFAYI